MAHFFVKAGDVTRVTSDLLLLKHAQDFYGADQLVATRLIAGDRCRITDIRPAPGHFVLVDTHGIIAPKQVMFLGTPYLPAFTYAEMYRFARKALRSICDLGLVVETITTTVHGTMYGLDGGIALEHLVRGFRDELAEIKFTTIDSITFLTLEAGESRKLNAKLVNIQDERR